MGDYECGLSWRATHIFYPSPDGAFVALSRLVATFAARERASVLTRAYKDAPSGKRPPICFANLLPVVVDLVEASGHAVVEVNAVAAVRTYRQQSWYLFCCRVFLFIILINDFSFFM